MGTCFYLITSCTSSKAVTLSSTFKSVFIEPLGSGKEYQIYNAIIESNYASYPILIILDQTNYFYESNADDFEYLKETLPSLDKEIVADYLKRNNRSYQLKDLFAPYGTEIVLVDVGYVDWIFKAEDFDKAWQTFHEIHSKSYGFITLSKVGVNTEQDQAIVFVQGLCGPTCGIGEFFLLSKINKRWQVDKKVTIFLA